MGARVRIGELLLIIEEKYGSFPCFLLPLLLATSGWTTRIRVCLYRFIVFSNTAKDTLAMMKLGDALRRS